jgi:predicted thioredoxin/glutaredoxin
MLVVSQSLFIKSVLHRDVHAAYCIFAQLTNSNILGKLPIRDSNSRVNWKLLLVDLAKIQQRTIFMNKR